MPTYLFMSLFQACCQVYHPSLLRTKADVDFAQGMPLPLGICTAGFVSEGRNASNSVAGLDVPPEMSSVVRTCLVDLCKGLRSSSPEY